MQEFQNDQQVYVRVSGAAFSSLNRDVRFAFNVGEIAGWHFAIGRYVDCNTDDQKYPHRVMFLECNGQSEIFQDHELSPTRYPEHVVDYAVTDEGGVV